MILNTGSRTDIPAYYGMWFLNRLREGWVYSRNPYNPGQITKYMLHPDVVDCIVFCTKNPKPFLQLLETAENGKDARIAEGAAALRRFRQFWNVTITPYGRDIEPNVPPKEQVIESLKKITDRLSASQVVWRYDPIFLSEKYPLDWHLQVFEKMAHELSGYTKTCVISFIDLYAKTIRNFSGVKPVDTNSQEIIGQKFAEIGKRYGIRIQTCCEGTHLKKYGIDCSGCLSQEVIEKACNIRLNVPGKAAGSARMDCDCLLGSDIGAYNTCGHGCLYCYANYDEKTVRQNMRLHDPNSPLLIGDLRPEDVIKNAKQISWIDEQLSLF